MAGIDPTQAVRNFLKPLYGTLSCITATPLLYKDPINPNEDYVLFLGDGGVIKLRSSLNIQIGLLLSMHFKVIEAEGELGKWKVKTLSYNYQIYQEGSELLAYHWHPDSISNIKFPHLHVKGITGKLHCPTGRVSVEEVVRLLILDFKVKTKNHNWEDVLIRAQKRFEQFRTWANLPNLQ